MTVTLHPLGIALAFIFVVSLGLLFWWMFRVPRPVPREVASIPHSVAAMQRILVPVSGTIHAERAVELACRLGEAQKAEIVLVYVVEVPFTLSLDAPLPQEDTKGHEALAPARFIVEQHGLPARTRTIPHRSASGGILHLAQEEMADAIVMSVGAGRPGAGEAMGRTAQEVVRKAECEVILDKAPKGMVSRWRAVPARLESAPKEEA